MARRLAVVTSTVLLVLMVMVSLSFFWFQTRLTAENSERNVVYVGIESGWLKVVRDHGSTYLNHWGKRLPELNPGGELLVVRVPATVIHPGRYSLAGSPFFCYLFCPRWPSFVGFVIADPQPP